MTILSVIWLAFGGVFAVVLSAFAYEAFMEWREARKWAEKYGKVMKK
ncbi:hypothetical membrane protein [Thermococcus kodakarensis KOD1]|uniref:Hypothetical membrane protein n=1 Tax=Thermococcus kodakarensis (strain ATCC BAA-918 / JCM 12380 / KOD1) TaxID=69014 RepID=Q5JFA2_THEKO|nr:hypothetical protein [Thermococcus kodakarensis]WCN28659.1 hypothetical protein POG15_03145 [Thermococcus kodakarensis]WCN30957.1 hypothetical protein POG21_03145 [Thermococcus kodakarensis]BAD84802.1 hypothetical membrane protein [Thermococcus kodakarensis KOD1]